MGDSPIRETATNIMMQFHKKDEYGFHHMDLSLTQVHLPTTTTLAGTLTIFYEGIELDELSIENNI